MTIIYLIRHSKPLKVNNNSNSDSLQIQNEKSSLSIEGENIANLFEKNKLCANLTCPHLEHLFHLPRSTIV